MKQRRPRRAGTFLDQCVQRAGLTRGAIVHAWAMGWARESYRRGKVLTTAEYAETFGLSERTAWRHRAAIHRAFPEVTVPVVVQLVVQELEKLDEPELMTAPRLAFA